MTICNICLDTTIFWVYQIFCITITVGLMSAIYGDIFGRLLINVEPLHSGIEQDKYFVYMLLCCKYVKPLNNVVL